MLTVTACVVSLLLSLQVAASPGPLLNRADENGDATSSGSCSAESYSDSPSFVLQEYEIDTVVGANNITETLATFAVENPGSGDIYRLERIPVSTGGGVWSVCRAGETPLPSELQLCQYILERRPGGRVGFRFQWSCDSEDASEPPLVFDATIIADLPAEVCEARDGDDGVTRSCGLEVEELMLPIANIDWVPASDAVKPSTNQV